MELQLKTVMCIKKKSRITSMLIRTELYLHSRHFWTVQPNPVEQIKEQVYLALVLPLRHRVQFSGRTAKNNINNI